MKSLFTIIFLLFFILDFNGQELILTGNPPRNSSLEIKGSGMQHYAAIRIKGKEKFLLWPVINQNGRQKYLTELDSSFLVFGFLPNGDPLKIGINEDSAGIFLSYNFDVEGFHVIYLIHKSVSDGVLNIEIAKANRLNHKCRNGHSGIQKKIDWKSYPEIADFEIMRLPIHLEDFHTILKSSNEIYLKTLFKGKPSSNNEILIETSKGWEKKLITDENGEAEFQLITDQFKPVFYGSKKEFYMHFFASKTIDSIGVFNGVEFSKIKYSTSLEQEYTFAEEVYKSKLWGFVIFFASLIIISFLVLFYRKRKEKYSF